MKCEKCQEVCIPLTVKDAPAFSEWYCSKCHKSYKMPKEDYNRVMTIRLNNGGK